MVSQSLCLIYLEHDFFPFFSLLIQIFLSPYEEGPFSLYYISFFNKTNEEQKKWTKNTKQMRKNFHRQNHQFVEKTRIRLKRKKKKKLLLFFILSFSTSLFIIFFCHRHFFHHFFFFLFRKEGRTESKRQNQSSLKEKVESFRADDYKGSHLTEICFCHQKNARHNDKRWSRKSAIFAFGSPFLTLFFLLIRFFFLSGCPFFFSLSKILFNHFLFFMLWGGLFSLYF